MPGYRSRPGQDPRQYSARPRDDFYDDCRSRSRSPTSHDPPHRRQSPPHDAPRGPSQYNVRDRSYAHDQRDRSPRNYHSHNTDRRDHDRSFSRSPRRGRRSEDARSHSDSHSCSRSRSRSRGQSRSRSRSRSRHSYHDRPSSRGRPSKEIMMEGLAPHLTENDVMTELQSHYHVERLDDVRIIRDRQTKQSRQFGFLRFATLDEAEAFMDANYPAIYLYGSSDNGKGSDDAKVRIAFGRERRDTRPDDADWICKMCNINNYATRARCFRCQTLKPEPSANQKPANVGDNDAASDNTPSQFLLLRGLESSVSEELLVKGVAKLNKPPSTQTQSLHSASKKGAKVASTTGDANLGAKEGTLRRVLLVRDRKSNESWRYGFAEYASIEDAQAALTRYNSFDRFTIASRLVLVSYIHAGVFIPVLNPTASTERFTFSPLSNPAMRLAYWDEEAYVTEFVVSKPESTSQTSKQHSSSQADIEGIKGSKDGDKNKKRKAQDPSSNPATAKKAAASHLQFWSNRHAELHGIKSKDQDGSDNLSSSEAIPPPPPTKSYADPKRHCCYLCMRQFTTQVEVNKHERLSDLHRSNLDDEAKVRRAEHKLAKHGVSHQQTTSTSSPATAPTSEYRDRAKERRKVYGVVNKKGEQVKPTNSKRAARSNDDDDNEDEPDQDDEGGTTSADFSHPQSKGAHLLSKMGYTAGQGLGASGEGRTSALTQDIYVAGVGLGAAGGKVGDAVKEAERNTKGDYKGFVERSREGARERYRNL